MRIRKQKNEKKLVSCHNLNISNQIYPERWLKILNIMLEKGKGLLLGKLRTTKLVEANFKLLMRVFIIERIIGLIETDEIFEGN